jgi:hypothetical protein
VVLPHVLLRRLMDEATLAGLIQHSLTSELVPIGRAALLATSQCECLRESLLAELLDGFPTSQTALQDALSDSAAGVGADLSEAEVESIAASLFRAFDAEKQRLDAAAAAEAAVEAGCCELCERRMPLTKHHVRPRSQHARLRTAGFTLAALSATIKICRQCHNAVHENLDEQSLADAYHTVELLLTHEGVRAFVGWASKQRSRGDVNHKLQVKR